MEIVTFVDGWMTYRDCVVQIESMFTEDNICYVHVINEQNDFSLILVADNTIINGVLQTSAQMIYDTLSA